jgi:predicted nucleic acid-binding protein
VSAVFLDTAGLIAIWNQADQWHFNAKTAFDKITAGRRSLTTTSFILLECGNAASRRKYRLQPNKLRNKLAKSGGLVFPTDEDWENAWSAYAAEFAGQAGIVDQVSFQVMRRLGIKEAFTNDKHFEAAGFKVLF